MSLGAARRRIALFVAAAALPVLALPAAYLLHAAPGSRPAASIQAAPAVDNRGHLYVLDGWGGVHPVGSAPGLATTASWPHRDIAQSLAMFPDGSGGYVMDGWGALHAVGAAPQIASGALWDKWNFARAVVMAPWSSAAEPNGWVLDGYGQLRPFGGAPDVVGAKYWPGTDSARSVVIMATST